MLGRHVEIIEGAENFEAREDAINPVIFSARRLGIEMRARHHRWQIISRTLAPGENIAHLVHLDGAARLLTPG